MSLFELEKTNAAARAGFLRVRGCRIPTPVFMPVGTLGTVKSVPQPLLQEWQYELILANAYHLYLRPGTETLRATGGLHRFMNWPHAILTDSGGYQVFSQLARAQVAEEGVSFRSHVDGSAHFFTPEKALEVQYAIGADIVMPFDDCPPYTASERYAKEALLRTQRWWERSIVVHRRRREKTAQVPFLFSILQGGCYPKLRDRAVEHALQTDPPGYAIGGLSVGEPAAQMYEVTERLTAQLPEERPRYLMGVGRPENILQCVARGVDMFDCVLPTRNGRNGMLFTTEGVLNIRNERWKYDPAPIDAHLAAETNNTYSAYGRSYVRHLFAAREMLGPHIASVHNLIFYRWLMQQARAHIVAQSFFSWKKEVLPQLTTRL